MSVEKVLQKNADGSFNFDHDATVDILTGQKVSYPFFVFIFLLDLFDSSI